MWPAFTSRNFVRATKALLFPLQEVGFTVHRSRRSRWRKGNTRSLCILSPSRRSFFTNILELISTLMTWFLTGNMQNRNLAWTLMSLFLSGKYNIYISLYVFLKQYKFWINPSFSGVLCNTWKVDYHQQRICAVSGSSVVIPCSFYYPDDHIVEKCMWAHVKSHHHFKACFISDRKLNTRFRCIGDRQHNCSLKIHKVERKDAGKYVFRFTTNSKEGKWTGRDGPILKVAGKFSFS